MGGGLGRRRIKAKAYGPFLFGKLLSKYNKNSLKGFTLYHNSGIIKIQREGQTTLEEKERTK